MGHAEEDTRTQPATQPTYVLLGFRVPIPKKIAKPSQSALIYRLGVLSVAEAYLPGTESPHDCP